MHNRRTDDRRRLLATAHLLVPGTGAPTACVLRDLSAGGARLAVAAPRDVPADLVLAVGPGEAPRPARVVWRGATEVGVAFPATAHAGDAPVPATGTVVSLAAARAARDAPGDAERLAERVLAVTRPRSRPLPFWALPT